MKRLQAFFVDEVGYVLHPTIKHAALHLMALSAMDCWRLSALTPKTHFEYLLNGEVPNKYKPQMAWQMACTGAKWVDLYRLIPRAPEGLQYFQIHCDVTMNTLRC